MLDIFNEPCDGVTAATTGITADNCRSVAGIANVIAENGEYLQDGSSIFGPNTGNSNLTEEAADTFTFGIVITPESLQGFSFIADYFNIEVKDAISSVDSQLAGDLCYSDVNFATNRFCSSITKDEDGQVSRLVNQEENLNRLISEEVDVTMAYEFELSSLPGKFKSKINYAYVMSLTLMALMAKSSMISLVKLDYRKMNTVFI